MNINCPPKMWRNREISSKMLRDMLDLEIWELLKMISRKSKRRPLIRLRLFLMFYSWTPPKSIKMMLSMKTLMKELSKLSMKKDTTLPLLMKKETTLKPIELEMLKTLMKLNNKMNSVIRPPTLKMLNPPLLEETLMEEEKLLIKSKTTLKMKSTL